MPLANLPKILEDLTAINEAVKEECDDEVGPFDDVKALAWAIRTRLIYYELAALLHDMSPRVKVYNHYRKEFLRFFTILAEVETEY